VTEIGCMAHAWVKREANKAEPAGILKVESTLGSSAPSGNEHAGCANDAQIASQDGSPFHEPAPVAWLRRYSNYLTPKLGPLGASFKNAHHSIRSRDRLSRPWHLNVPDGTAYQAPVWFHLTLPGEIHHLKRTARCRTRVPNAYHYALLGDMMYLAHGLLIFK
jgi:hypothetical protein